MKDLLRRCCDPAIASRAAPVALCVGSMLNLINHYDLLLGAPLASHSLMQMALTYVVPYCVSTHGQVWRHRDGAARDGAQDKALIPESGYANRNPEPRARAQEPSP